MICDCVETSSETVAQCDKRDVYNFFSRQAECRHASGFLLDLQGPLVPSISKTLWREDWRDSSFPYKDGCAPPPTPRPERSLEAKRRKM